MLLFKKKKKKLQILLTSVLIKGRRGEFLDGNEAGLRGQARDPQRSTGITESQNHRVVGVGRDLCGSSSPTLLPKHLQAGCTGPCPGGAGISPEKETPHPPWAAWARAPAPSEGRSSSSGSAGASSAPVCAHCPMSCRWAPLERVWPHPPDPHPADICKHL